MSSSNSFFSPISSIFFCVKLIKDQNLKDLCTLNLIEVLGGNCFKFSKVIAELESKVNVMYKKIYMLSIKAGNLFKRKKKKQC